MVRLRLWKVVHGLVVAGLICAAFCTALAAEDVLLVDVTPGQPPAKMANVGSAPQGAPEKTDWHLVSFVCADSVLEEAFLADGDPVPPPSGEPAQEGCVFLYWVDETASASIPFAFGSSAIGDLTLAAVFAEIPQRAENPTPPPSFPPRDLVYEPPDPPADASGASPVSRQDSAAALDPALAGCSILVYTSHTDTILAGQVIHLWAEISGFEGLDVSFRWQYYAGGKWRDADGATALQHSFIATPETVNYPWQLVASVVR